MSEPPTDPVKDKLTPEDPGQYMTKTRTLLLHTDPAPPKPIDVQNPTRKPKNHYG